MSTPRLTVEAVFFKAVEPGDIKKHQNESNIAASGGGARDLRVPKSFQSRLERFFPDPSPGERAGVRQGVIRWRDPANAERQTVVQLWPPTQARPGEIRIGRINIIDAWTIDEAEFNAATQNGETWFYLLTRTAAGEVWAQVIKQQFWKATSNIRVRRLMEKCIANRGTNNTICGYVGLQSNDEYSNVDV